jgi:hypothetical protein
LTSKSFIYTDFSPDIIWLKERIKKDFFCLSPDLQLLANYYLSNRLSIISPQQNREEDPELGRPVPYAVFWFADALKYKSVETIRKLVLALTYSAIITTIHDDVLDEKVVTTHNHKKLIDFFDDKYKSIFNLFFVKSSNFWKYYRECEEEFQEYQRWRIREIDTLKIDPLSEEYLWQASRYFSAVVKPSLIALCLISGNENEIPRITNFLRFFSIGWRVFDDLNDWHIDFTSSDYNRSSILLLIKQDYGDRQITDSVIQSYFMDEAFINRTCGTMIEYFKCAENTVSGKTKYLDKFLAEQIEFHSKRRDYLLGRRRDFFSDLENSVKKHEIK